MYENDFHEGSSGHPKEPRKIQYMYKRNNVKSRASRKFDQTYYRDNDIIVDSRRHSLEPQDNVPIYEKFIRPVVYSPTYGELNGAGVARASYHYLEPDYIDDQSINEDQSQGINTEKVVRNLTAIGRFLEMLQGWPLPRLSLTTACICFILAIFISPRPCVENIIFPTFRLSFGTLYPAYASYKAVRTKNVKEYVKWMMYWIVYAFFTCTETFTDIFLSWFPFYYEVKVVIVLWLLSPATKGSSTLYRKFVHPMLTRREQEIDEYLNQAKERGYSAVLQLGSKGVNYATNVIMQTAIKGGGNLVQTIRRSYSLSDLSEPDIHRTQDEIDDVVTMRPQARMLRPRLNTSIGRSASGTRHSTGMYFTEVDVTAKGAGDFNYNIRSSDDISSGYSSAEPISGGLSRTSSMTNASKSRLKAKRSEAMDQHIELDANKIDKNNFGSSNSQISLNYVDQIINQTSDIQFTTSESYNTDTTVALIFEDLFDTEDLEQSDEFFETNSNASNDILTDDDNVKMPKLEHNVDLTHANLNLNEMRASLKEIENDFRENIKDSTSSTTSINISNNKPYIHNKGKAPKPPKRLDSSTIESTSSTPNIRLINQGNKYVKETEI